MYEDLKKWIVTHKLSAHTFAVVWLFLDALWYGNADFHAYASGLLMALPAPVHGVVFGVVVPGLVYWKAHRTANADDQQRSPGSGGSAAMILLLLTGAMLMLPGSARAQDVDNLYMAGGSYNAGATPAVAGSALYAHQINDSGTYAFTMIDALPQNTKPFTVTTNIGAGIAQRVLTINGVSLFMPTGAGISYTGKNVGWSWTTGLGVPIRWRDSWYFMPSVRMLKSSVSGGAGYQPIVGLLFGWGQ